MNSQESEKMDAVSKNAENNPAQENSSADEKNVIRPSLKMP